MFKCQSAEPIIRNGDLDLTPSVGDVHWIQEWSCNVRVVVDSGDGVVMGDVVKYPYFPIVVIGPCISLSRSRDMFTSRDLWLPFQAGVPTPASSVPTDLGISARHF